MTDLTPITRLEYDLDGIVNNHSLLDPITRVEMYLSDIAAGRTASLSPITRIEMYLAKISGASVEVPAPITRIEMYLAAIAGEDVETPDPITRVEYWLDQWADQSGSGVITTATGITPLVLANALDKSIRKLIQYGKVTTSNGDMYCNNGKLVAVDDELSVVGTPEVLTVGEQTATVENLLAVDDIADEQNIISGTVTRRCEAVISDGTTPSGRYIGTVGDGNIIVKVRETGYEGDVATFEADSVAPLNGLTVNVEPIQDLHGYDSPWPAGGGKNLFNWDRAIGTPNPSVGEASVPQRVMDTERYYVGLTRNNYYYPERITQYSISNGVVSLTSSSGGFGIGFPVKVDPSTVYAVSYADATNAKISEGFYDADWNYLSHIDAGVTFTTPANAAYVTLIVTPINVGECSLSNIQLELGSTATSFAPYSNICPISGRTSATVTRTGRNLLDVSNTTHNNYNIGSIPNTLKPNTEYTFSINGATTQKYRLYLAKSSNPLSAVTALNSAYIGAGEPRSFTTPNDMSDFDLLCLAGSANGAGNEELSSILPQIELGSNASAYEPYQGNTYTIALGDTVYGGTLDVTGGKMVVDRAYLSKRIGDMNNTDTAPGWKSSGAKDIIGAGFNAQIVGAICSAFSSQFIRANTNGVNDILFFPASGIGKTQTELIAAMPDLTVGFVIPLATPFEITLTPTQIDTLLGQNNVWSDAGTVKAYVADGDVIEHVTAQPLRTVEGSNTVSVTSAVAPVQLSATYTRAET